ncbi:MAG: hypothetical protein HIU81_02935 [Acidobacteria bacterium]|nr:hypothetical protein [Acidobacteriota bacterium]
MNPKLHVVVRLNLDSAGARIESARITVRGHVTAESVEALYVVAKRANCLMTGLSLLLDLAKARVDPEALERLHGCVSSGQLPAHIDTSQVGCRLSVLDPRQPVPAVVEMALAA